MALSPAHIKATITRLTTADDLKSRAMRGAALTTAGDGMVKLVQLGGNLIVTRLLTPEIFGLMALATVLVLGLQLFTDIGVSASVVRSKRSDEPIYLRTAWTLQMIRGAVIAMVALAASPYLAQLYGEPSLEAVIAVLALTVIFRSCASIELAVKDRNLALSRPIILQITVTFTTMAVTILAAWQLRSVWAFVIGQIVGTALHALLSYPLLKARFIGFGLERAAVSEIFVYGRWVLLATALGFLGMQGLRSVQGYLVPLDILGFIALATTLANVVSETLNRIAAKVAFPALAQIARERPEDLSRTVRRIRLATYAVAAPTLITLSFFGQPIVDLLYDPRYAMAGVFLTLLPLNAILLISPYAYQSAQLALGNSRSHAVVMGVLAAANVIGVVAGYAYGGELWMIAGMAAASAVQSAVSLAYAARKGFATFDIDLAIILLVGAVYAYHLSVI